VALLRYLESVLSSSGTLLAHRRVEAGRVDTTARSEVVDREHHIVGTRDVRRQDAPPRMAAGGSAG
jgi:hypothetical protein